MSLVVKSQITWFQRFCISVIKVGPVPQHLALIMDGNRRFAKKQYIHRTIGYTRGAEKLGETLQWCQELGITEVTVYAFSIENFKRSTEEVSMLMDLVREEFKSHIHEKDKLMSEGICIRALGNLSLLPADIRQLLAEIIIMTKDNNKFFLNLALSYTSGEEITTAVSTVVNGVRSGLIKEDDIDEQLLSSCLYTNKSRDPDLVIRTSGETRLSDFLLQQIKFSTIYFADILWPEFSIWHLLGAVFMYQRSCMNNKFPKNTLLAPTINSQNFLENVEASRWLVLQQYAADKK